jgi:hypothetical protein
MCSRFRYTFLDHDSLDRSVSDRSDEHYATDLLLSEGGGLDDVPNAMIARSAALLTTAACVECRQQLLGVLTCSPQPIAPAICTGATAHRHDNPIAVASNECHPSIAPSGYYLPVCPSSGLLYRFHSLNALTVVRVLLAEVPPCCHAN